MQSDISRNDITAINIELNELRSKFDYAMREGDDSLDLKEIYLHIKELECHINALQWDPSHPTLHQHMQSSPTWR